MGLYANKKNRYIKKDKYLRKTIVEEKFLFFCIGVFFCAFSSDLEVVWHVFFVSRNLCAFWSKMCLSEALRPRIWLCQAHDCRSRTRRTSKPSFTRQKWICPLKRDHLKGNVIFQPSIFLRLVSLFSWLYSSLPSGKLLLRHEINGWKMGNFPFGDGPIFRGKTLSFQCNSFTTHSYILVFTKFDTFFPSRNGAGDAEFLWWDHFTLGMQRFPTPCHWSTNDQRVRPVPARMCWWCCEWRKFAYPGDNSWISQRIHVWYIYLHLP